jgi:hypothetical protein
MTPFAKDLTEMMQVWNLISETAARQFPNASAEELYQIAFGAMNDQLSKVAA